MNGDAELLHAYAETGTDAPFREFVHRHLNLAYFAALRRTSGQAPAEYVTQCVFTEVARNAGSLACHASLTGWLYVTTRNVAVRALRKERTRQRREEETRIIRPKLYHHARLEG